MVSVLDTCGTRPCLTCRKSNSWGLSRAQEGPREVADLVEEITRAARRKRRH